MNLTDLPDRLASLYGERTAVRVLGPPLLAYPGLRNATSVSYVQLADCVARIGGGLAVLGVRRGDRVALMTLNRFEMFLVAFGVARLGAIPVPLHYQLRPAEVDAILARLAATMLVTDRTVSAGMPRSALSSEVKRVTIDDTDGESLLAMAAAAPPVSPARVKITEPALIFFSSGTTGAPKGATLSHAAAVVGAKYHGRLFALRPRMGRPLVLAAMPVAHVGGYAAMLTYLAVGWPILFCPYFIPSRLLGVMERWRVTAFTGTPSMYRLLLQAGAADRDLSSMRIWAGGADAFSDDLVRRFRDMATRRGPFGLRRRPMFIRGYGMAEANGYVAQTPPFPVGDRCIGWIMPPVKYRIVNDAGNDAPPGTEGELLLSGPTIAVNYWNDEDETAAHFRDGWFWTGDIVRRGRWGMLYFEDRARDTIKSGGFKIAAAEIDNVLEAHPAVLHAATVGLPHGQLGEQAVSAVVVQDGADIREEDLMRWARARLASPKCPRTIVFVPSLPLTFTDKPRRREVRAMLASRNDVNGDTR